MAHVSNDSITLQNPTDKTVGCNFQQELLTISVASVISLSYVASLYIHPLGPNWIAFPARNRDDPLEVRTRFVKVFCASVISFIICIIFQWRLDVCGKEPNLRCWLGNMGIREIDFWGVLFRPLMQTLILFAGPISGDYFLGRWRGYNRAFFSLLYYNLHFRRRIFRDTIYSLHWWRAYIVAPLSEEFVYRSCLISVVKFCYGISTSIFISPLAFGIAHLHHIFDRIRLGTPAKSAIITTAFQIAYTSVFGIYSAFLFVKTGNVVAPILVHALCNYLGVPDFHGFGQLEKWRQLTIVCLYFGGLVSWIFINFPFTEFSLE